MFNGRRQPSCDGTSRMMREYHVRFCEGLGVKFPGPTRQDSEKLITRRTRPLNPHERTKPEPRRLVRFGPRNSACCCLSSSPVFQNVRLEVVRPGMRNTQDLGIDFAARVSLEPSFEPSKVISVEGFQFLYKADIITRSTVRHTSPKIDVCNWITCGWTTDQEQSRSGIGPPSQIDVEYDRDMIAQAIPAPVCKRSYLKA